MKLMLLEKEHIDSITIDILTAIKIAHPDYNDVSIANFYSFIHTGLYRMVAFYEHIEKPEGFFVFQINDDLLTGKKIFFINLLYAWSSLENLHTKLFNEVVQFAQTYKCDVIQSFVQESKLLKILEQFPVRRMTFCEYALTSKNNISI